MKNTGFRLSRSAVLLARKAPLARAYNNAVAAAANSKYVPDLVTVSQN